MADNTIITKYRPTCWEELLGNEKMFESLRKNLAGDLRPHAYLFTGGSGQGKTTTARIVASELGIADVVEIDAASFSGIDDIRGLVDQAQYRSLSGAFKMYIIDECHALSKPAWQVLLKIIEEPPEHLYFALCTTELQKVPATIVQRCFHVLLRPVDPNSIMDLITAVSELEGWNVPADVLDAVVGAAGGSPRKALSTLQAVHEAESREEVKRIISLQSVSDPVIEIVQHILKGGRVWDFVKEELKKIPDDEFEGSLIAVCRYIMAWMVNARTDKEAAKASELLNLLLQPVSTPDPKAIFYNAVTALLWAA